VLAGIRADEGEVLLREFGLGMNRAFSLERNGQRRGTSRAHVAAFTSHSAQDATFAKANIQKRQAAASRRRLRLTSSVTVDGEIVFQTEAWRIEALSSRGARDEDS